MNERTEFKSYSPGYNKKYYRHLNIQPFHAFLTFMHKN